MYFLYSVKASEKETVFALEWCAVKITLVAMRETILLVLSHILLRTWTHRDCKHPVQSSLWLKNVRVGSCFQTNSIVPNGFCGCNQRACIIELALLKCPSCYPSSNLQAFVRERAILGWKQSNLCSLLQNNGCHWVVLWLSKKSLWHVIHTIYPFCLE